MAGTSLQINRLQECPENVDLPKCQQILQSKLAIEKRCITCSAKLTSINNCHQTDKGLLQ